MRSRSTPESATRATKRNAPAEGGVKKVQKSITSCFKFRKAVRSLASAFEPSKQVLSPDIMKRMQQLFEQDKKDLPVLQPDRGYHLTPVKADRKTALQASLHASRSLHRDQVADLSIGLGATLQLQQQQVQTQAQHPYLQQ